MNFSYDKKADAMVLVIKPSTEVARDVEVAPNVFIGYGADESVVEIQIVEISEMENPWFNMQAAAAMLGVSERTLQRRIQEGVVKPKKVGREFRLSAKDLEKLKSAD